MTGNASWFFVFSGAVLVLTGLLQFKFRPPQKGFSRYTGVAFSTFCIVMGVVVVLYGLGYRPWAGSSSLSGGPTYANAERLRNNLERSG